MRKLTTGCNPLEINYHPAKTVKTRVSKSPIWISPQGNLPSPAVVAYRLNFSLPEEITATLHVSADERYELWLDGERVGRGPERSTPAAWFFETYELTFTPGDRVLVARVWQLGQQAPVAQQSVAPGFLLAAGEPYANLLSTGQANWEAKQLQGYSFDSPHQKVYMVVGPHQTIDGNTYPWGIETGDKGGEGWEPAARRREDDQAVTGIIGERLLRPATLPAQLSRLQRAGTVRFASDKGSWETPDLMLVPAGASQSELVNSWQQLLKGPGPVVIPPATRQQVVIDLEQYYCAYPRLRVSGGAGSSITLGWAEALYLAADAHEKGQRDEVEGRYFAALMRDQFKPDGGDNRLFETLWWRAGRYIEVLVETAGEALTIEELTLEETRYPLEMESRFSSDTPALDRVIPIALRGLQMCAHETYMDCPYYEQLMYVGDTRLEVLTTLALAADDRLPRKALTMFDISRFSGGWGLVQSRFPSREVQYIPPFALWWVAMVNDFALWRNDPVFIKSLLPGVHATIDHFLALLNEEGIMGVPPGWNFEDWAENWLVGNPPAATEQPSGLLNWHLVYTLTLAAQLEEEFGEPELAQLYRRRQKALTGQVVNTFWDEERGLFADEPGHLFFSEHTQCLALLSGMVEGTMADRVGQGLLRDANLTRTTIYFSHYLFETYRLLGQGAALFERLKLWMNLPEQGFKTTPEQPEPSRSDCHGWGAHPLFHYFATIIGIRPESYGFHRVSIRPLMGPLKQVSGTLVHPNGDIEVALTVAGSGKLSGSITLPHGVNGTLNYGEITQKLLSGLNEIN